MNMNPANFKANATNRKGGMLVMMAVVMVIFMLISAFCVDIAYMHMVKAEMRTAVDAASRAGTEALARTQDPDAALNAAMQIAEQNSVAGNGLSLNAAEVQIGTAQLQTNGKFTFSNGGSKPNSVSVIGRRDASGPDGSINLFFGHIFGVDSFSPVLDSVSASSVRDIALVLDRSGSMGTALGSGTRLSALISAVNVFLDEVQEISPNSTISLTTYSDASTRDIPLSANFSSILSSVNDLAAEGNTNIFQGLQQGSDSLEEDSAGRRFAEKTIVVMTDGNFNTGGTPVPSAEVAVGRQQQIHTITFSAEADQAIMQEVAEIGHGVHVHADDAADLNEAFREIARTFAVLTIE